MICNAAMRKSNFYGLMALEFKSLKKQGSQRFLHENEIILVIRDARKGPIFLRDLIFVFTEGFTRFNLEIILLKNLQLLKDAL